MSLEKKAKMAALQKLKSMMSQKDAEHLRGLKKGPPAPLEQHAEPDGDEDDSGFKQAWGASEIGQRAASMGGAYAMGGKLGDAGKEDRDDEGPMDHDPEPMPDLEGEAEDERDILSEDEKQRIRDLYHKHCM